MHYIRASDGFPVSRDEACTPAGALKSGYKIRTDQISDGQRVDFEVAFMDRAPAGNRVTFRDTTVTLTDAETTIAVARAKRDHVYRTAHLGDRAPAFTDAQRDAAVAQASAAKSQSAALLDAGTLQRARDVAEAQRAAAYAVHKDAIRNAWKNGR